jgi:hypothetical protein
MARSTLPKMAHGLTVIVMMMMMMMMMTTMMMTTNSKVMEEVNDVFGILVQMGSN